jgi:hypothetical protein
MCSLFDIFTTHRDGRVVLVESVSRLDEAKDMAHHLSLLFSGESFGYFERADSAMEVSATSNVGDRMEAAPALVGLTSADLPA